MRYYLSILIIGILVFSCKKQKTRSGDNVEFYLLKSYNLVSGKCQVDPASAELEQIPLIGNTDILQYSQTDYQYTVTDASIQKVKSLNPRTPFAVAVDKKVVYYGIYMPSFMSSTCDHSITMDLAWESINKINLRLGYPGILPGVTIDDQRNNSALMAALSKQEKLK